MHVGTRQLGLHGFGAVPRRKEVQSPLEALRRLYALVMDERRVCSAQETRARALSHADGASASGARQRRGHSRLHSFLSDVMEDRLERLALASPRASRGPAWRRKRLYSSFCSGLNLGGRGQTWHEGTCSTPAREPAPNSPTAHHLLDLHRKILGQDVRRPPDQTPVGETNRG